MEQGFDGSGAAVASDSEHCVYVLSELNGRPLFHRRGAQEEAGSMYFFGQLACSAIKRGFSWDEILDRVPDPGTEEKRSLREKLHGQRAQIIEFVEEEITQEGISPAVYDQLAELFCRLFPAYGNFADGWNFLSDNFYSFDPSWNFRSYHSAPDFRSLVVEAFGSYRKDLARAVAQSNGSAIALLSRFSDSLTVEQMVELLGELRGPNCNGWGFMGTSFDGALADLSSFNRLQPALRFRLVADLLARLEGDADDGFATAAMVEDTLTMLESVPEGELKRFRSDRTWDQVHTRAVALASDEQIESLDPISFPGQLLSLENEELPGRLRLKLLRTPLDFLKAGSKSGLDNCMGKAGYYTKAKNGESYCFVGYADRELIAGMELRFKEGSWQLLQLNGPGNRPLEGRRELKDHILVKLNGERGDESQQEATADPPQIALDDAALDELLLELIRDRE